FYRGIKLALGTPTTPPYADDFRLIDHQGVSRSLYYYQNATNMNGINIKAIVLIFTGNGCSNVQQLAATINALTNFNSQGVITWLIDANSADNRSNIVSGHVALGISTNIPILHDRAQLVARAYHATTTPEVVCISRLDFSIFYRGTIDDRLGSNSVSTTQYYLTNALSNFLANR